MDNVRRALRHHLTDAAGALERAPVEVVVATGVAVAFSHAVEAGDVAFQPWLELTVFALLAGTAAWTGTLLNALGDWSSRQRWLVTGLGFLAATVYATFYLRLDLAGHAWRAGALVVAAIAWAAAAPALGQPGVRVSRFRRVNGRILLRLLAAGLYAGSLFLGLAAALSAIDSLFDLEMRGTVYAHVFGWLAVGLVPWVVVGGVDDYARPLDQTSQVAAVIHRLAGYLLIPLLALYYAIVYAYAIRIAIIGELPRNLVSPMVLASGVIAVLAIILFDPSGGERDADDGATTSAGRAAGGAIRALRWAPPLFLPLGALGVWALAIRVDQYGWTEFRYLRALLLGLLIALAVFATVEILRRRRFSLHVIPLALAAALLLAAVGPWSALDVSRRSQRARLVSALTAAGLLDPGTASATPAPEERTVPAETYREITSTARYLIDHFGRDALAPLVPVDRLRDQDLRDLAGHLGLRAEESAERVRYFHARLEPGAVVPDIPGGMLYRIFVVGREDEVEPRSTTLSTSADGTRVEIDGPGGPVAAEVGPLARWLMGEAGHDAELEMGEVGDPPPPRHPVRTRLVGLPPERAAVPLLDATGTDRGRLVVLQLELQVDSGEVRIVRLEGVVTRAGG